MAFFKFRSGGSKNDEPSPGPAETIDGMRFDNLREGDTASIVAAKSAKVASAAASAATNQQ